MYLCYKSFLPSSLSLFLFGPEYVCVLEISFDHVSLQCQSMFIVCVRVFTLSFVRFRSFFSQVSVTWMMRSSWQSLVHIVFLFSKQYHHLDMCVGCLLFLIRTFRSLFPSLLFFLSFFAYQYVRSSSLLARYFSLNIEWIASMTQCSCIDHHWISLLGQNSSGIQMAVCWSQLA